MKKAILVFFSLMILFFEISSFAFTTSGGIEYDVAEPYGATGYTTVVPDTPQSGYDVFSKQNADVGVAINYEESVNLTFYKYDYLINITSDQPSYYCFDLGKNKVTANDGYEYYLLNSSCDGVFEFADDDLAKRYSSVRLLGESCGCDVEHLIHVKNDGGLKENLFRFYYAGTGTILTGNYYLVQTVEGDKTSTMNYVDVNFDYTTDTPVFDSSLNDKIYVGSTAVDDYYFDEAFTYKQKNNVFFNLYQVDSVSGGRIFTNIYYYGILPKDCNLGRVYGHDDSVSLNLTRYGCGFSVFSSLSSVTNNDLYTFFDSTTNWISTYNTLSLTYSYKVYTPVDVQEITFNDYKTSVSKLVSDTLDNVYQNAYNAGVISKQVEIDRLNNQVSTLSTELDSLRNEKKNLESNIAALNVRIEELELDSTISATKISELKAQVLNLTNEKETLENDIAEKEKKIDLLQNSISVMQLEINSFENEEKSNKSMQVAFSVVGGFFLIFTLAFIVIIIKHKVCD